MFPYKTSFFLDRKSGSALYLQLSHQFIHYIKKGHLPSTTKLIGTRSLAELLNVHRKTIVACYEELELQGWVETIPKKGTYVKATLPISSFQSNPSSANKTKAIDTVGFQFYRDSHRNYETSEASPGMISIDDGISDTRLAPTVDVARIYRKLAGKRSTQEEMSYGSTYGNLRLREVLVAYLNETRGLSITIDNLLITRGSQMGIWLSSQLLLKEGDCIVVGETNYPSADLTFLQSGATLLRVPVDEDGLCTERLQTILEKQVIKAVYVTSHHHHPSTVTLSAERRLRLLNMASHYKFAVIEDDYDYDFNYNHAPILPLASHDQGQSVIYIGSVCKAVAPVFRVGYLIASKSFVDEAARIRRFVDRQGDALLELTFSEFIRTGDMDRHIRKVMRHYERRRDLFCSLLQDALSPYLEFDIPKGGMAVWVRLKKEYSWERVAKLAVEEGVLLGNWERYDMAKTQHNGIRMGFARHNEEELKVLVSRLEKAFLRY